MGKNKFTEEQVRVLGQADAGMDVPQAPPQPVEPAPRPRQRSPWDRSDDSGSFSVWMLVATVLVLAFRFFQQGHRNIGFIASVAVAAGVLFVFLSPERFQRPKRRRLPDGEHRDLRDLSATPTPSSFDAGANPTARDTKTPSDAT